MPATEMEPRRETSLAARVAEKAKRARDWLDRGPVARDERAVWADAESLEDLCGLMDRWLAGDLKSQPNYYGSVDVDEEAAPGLTDACRRLNRMGFLTGNSQAGASSRDGYQRAAVDGFASKATVDVIRRKLRGTPYQVKSFRLARRFGSRIPVTWEAGQVFTRFGGGLPEEELRELWGGHVGEGAVRDLCAARQVVIYDPAMGRNALWADLRARL